MIITTWLYHLCCIMPEMVTTSTWSFFHFLLGLIWCLDQFSTWPAWLFVLRFLLIISLFENHERPSFCCYFATINFQSRCQISFLLVGKDQNLLVRLSFSFENIAWYKYIIILIYFCIIFSMIPDDTAGRLLKSDWAGHEWYYKKYLRFIWYYHGSISCTEW